MAEFLDQKDINVIVARENKVQLAKNAREKVKIIYEHVIGHALVKNKLINQSQIVQVIREISQKISESDIYYESFEKILKSAKQRGWI